MGPTIRQTHELLYEVQKHFNGIVEVLNQHELYDNNVRVSTDLFQVYFNMSMSIAKELIYLEEQENKLDEIVEAQVEAGEIDSRNR